MVARATHEEEWFKLSPEERAAWSGFIRAHATIVKELDAELQAAHGLPLSSYDVLVQLSLPPNGRMQMHELAEAVHLSRSGLTRLVDRLERQGMIERHRGERDPRQVFACITKPGLERLAETTPTHLSGVRRRFLERLSPTQVGQLAVVWDQLLASMSVRELEVRKTETRTQPGAISYRGVQQPE
jgi:DNA-binding MarR family transcriptional regulator